MANEKVSINIVSGVEKTKKDGSKYYIYKSDSDVEYISKNKYEEGAEYYYVSEVKGEFNGKPTLARWISTEEYKPQGKGGAKPFYPKQPDKVAILKEAGAIVDGIIAYGIEQKPKTREELWARIDRELKEVQGRVK
jgi:hypothetical protein